MSQYFLVILKLIFRNYYYDYFEKRKVFMISKLDFIWRLPVYFYYILTRYYYTCHHWYFLFFLRK
jgi:hypothetical protein